MSGTSPGMPSLPAADACRYVLLVDVGNTRLKWCLHDRHSTPPGPWLLQGDGLLAGSVASDAWSQPGAGGLLAALDMAMATIALPARQFCLCAARVGPHPWEKVLNEFTMQRGMAIEWVRSSARCGPLRNGYDNPASLGADRFLSALAVVHSFPGQAAVIATAGTATTVDAIDQAGTFLGGCILPGPALMAASLHQNTADLPQVDPAWAPFPRSTAVAIASGVVRAQVGVVTGMLSQLQQQTGLEPLLLVSGGGKIWITHGLPQAVVHDNLVLQGLARWARSRFARE